MKLFFLLFISTAAFSQNLLHQPENIKKFADNLFCSGDYLRAVEEYEYYLNSASDDTIVFKIFLSLSAMEKYDSAGRKAHLLLYKPFFRDLVIGENLKNLILQKEYYQLRETYTAYGSENPVHKKLRNFSYLYTEKDTLPSPPFMNLPFSKAESDDLQRLYERKLNLPFKDPVMAGFLSFLFPGAGKIYTEEYGDAFFAALATGVLGYLAYSNFKADHTVRGIIFTGLTGWFYGGSIYGSAASAQIFNARVNFSFTHLLDDYLEMKNFYLPDYGFCK